ncbi:hypothetical protein [Paraburkholderia sp. HP33-1]|uniref:hypothetical protein n=1 Tax=Paraburkholderia sp. HP33-1 TaxID=2883243 RepID=UPI001F342CB5|nr:hypothetical protein [Paraburkholderia sp. HP33-1]
MIRMMMATIGAPATTRGMRARRQVLMLRKVVGFAIVASGFAVIAEQALQHALGA